MVITTATDAIAIITRLAFWGSICCLYIPWNRSVNKFPKNSKVTFPNFGIMFKKFSPI